MAATRLHLHLPHDEADPNKRYIMPDPDGCLGESVHRLSAALNTGREVDISDVIHVLMLARGYLDLTTYKLGQECCAGKLRDIWRARRARADGVDDGE